MKVYLSGPMSGLPHFNIHAFDAVARMLRARDFEVVSPAELDDPPFRALCLECETGSTEELMERCRDAGIEPASWGDLLARDIKLLANEGIEGVVVLDGWQDSRGAVLETVAARLSDIPILTVSGPLLVPLSSVQLRGAHAQCAGRMHKDNGGPRPGPSETPPRLAVVEEEIASEARGVTIVTDTKEIRVTSDTGGQKGSKEAVIGDICPKALFEVARVAGMGRKKYARLNYLKGFDWSLSYDACQRHLMLFWAGQDTDDESGLPHLAHAAWQCLCLLAFSIRGLGRDDRP